VVGFGSPVVDVLEVLDDELSLARRSSRSSSPLHAATTSANAASPTSIGFAITSSLVRVDAGIHTLDVVAGLRQAVVMSDAVQRVRDLFALVDAMKTEEMLDWFTDDAVMELPFAPGKMPRRYEGRDAVTEFVTFVNGTFSSFTMTVDHVHSTDDPNLVVVETHSDAVVAENGRPYRNRYVTFVRFDDAGKVVEWREYYDAGEVVRAFRP
jgi:ketosteroid isomerase-like protein